MAGPPVRERYNAKARGSVAGGSHKKKRKQKPAVDEDGEVAVDGNGLEDIEESGDGRGKMSSKKRKRMDSYIVRWIVSTTPMIRHSQIVAC